MKIKEMLSANVAAITCIAVLAGTMPLVGCASAPAGQANQGGFVAAPPPPPRFTGDGGRGTRIAIMPLEPRGLPSGQEHLPAFVQGELLNNFRQNSDMIILDRAGLPAILMETESGIYSPDADFGRLGEIAGVDYFLMGNITATAVGYVLQLQVAGARRDTVGRTRASFSDTTTRAELDNLTSIRRASADLLRGMGVTLTAVAMRELTHSPTENEIRAENYLARSIAAQDRGNEIEAMLLAVQARIFNPQLTEAADRQSVLAAHIQTGNIGAGVLQEIAWRNAWVERLREAERFFDAARREQPMPYTLFYTTEIRRGPINWVNETVSLNITTHLHGTDIWTGSMEYVLNTVSQGLRATGRAQAWGFGNWPNQGTVTGVNVNARHANNFAVVFELINARSEVIGRQTLQTSGWWQRTSQGGINVNASDRRTLTFQNVSAHAITDGGMTVRVVSVNGIPAEAAARNGVLQIRHITQQEINRNDHFRFASGTILGFSNTAARNATLPNLVIPDTMWGDPVIAIGNGAFDGRQWGNTRLTHVTIPNSVTTIGHNAFRGNHMTRIIIPDSVRRIGEHAFWDERGGFGTRDRFGRLDPDSQVVAEEIHITIGGNVAMSGNPFRFGSYGRWRRNDRWVQGFTGFDGFVTNYAENGKQAGTYRFLFTRAGTERWAGGAGADIAALRRRDFRNMVLAGLGAAILLGGLITSIVIFGGEE